MAADPDVLAPARLAAPAGTSLAPAPPAPAATAGQPPGDPAADRSRRRLPADRLLLAASMAAAAVLGALNFSNFPIYSEDEGVYTMQAWSVLHGQLSPYTYWYDHPFLGWVQLAPFLTLGRALHLGNTFVAQTRLVSLVAVVLDAGLVYLIARRLRLRQAAAVLAVALFVLSPTAQDDMRKVFLDNVATPWVLAAVALALSPRRFTWHHTAAGACFAIAVLSKETTFLLAPVVLIAIRGNAEPRLRGLAQTCAAVAFGVVAGLYPLYALFRGELFPSASKVSIMHALKWQTSQRHYAVARWLAHDRELIVAGIAAAVVLLASRRLRPIALAVVVPTLWVLRPSGYLPAMFLIGALPFLALSVAAAADLAGARLAHFAGRGRVWLGTLAGPLGVVLAAATLGPIATGRLIAQGTFSRENFHTDQAIAWVEANIPRSRTILVDDVVWTDLAAAGWNDQWRGALWFYKLDTDPAAKRKLPDGWRDVAYVLSTAAMRRDVKGQANLVQCRLALQHSTLVHICGAGANEVELRAVRQ